MCAHPETVKSKRRVTSGGKSWFVTDCRECYRAIYQRKKALKTAFRQFATARWA